MQGCDIRVVRKKEFNNDNNVSSGLKMTLNLAFKWKKKCEISSLQAGALILFFFLALVHF